MITLSKFVEELRNVLVDIAIDTGKFLFATAAGVPIALLASAVTVGIGWLINGWAPSGDVYFPLSEGVWNLIGWVPCSAGALVLLLLPRFGIAAFATSIVVLPTPFYVAMLKEMADMPGSHNLFPFELLFQLLGSIAMHLPAFGFWGYLKFRNRHQAPAPDETSNPNDDSTRYGRASTRRP